MKRFPFYLAFALTLASCGGQIPVFPDEPGGTTEPSGKPGAVVIEPIITKASDTDFEPGDMIGLTVTTADGVYADNAPLTYNGSTFQGDLTWYMDQDKKSTLFAYYPYSQNGCPASFSVEKDQSKGTSASDFIIGTKKDVRPSGNSVSMVFLHKMSKITVYTANISDKSITSVSLNGLIPTATIDMEKDEVLADADVDPVSIKTLNVRTDTVWTAIAAPQTASIEVEVTMEDGKVLSKKCAAYKLEQGKNSTISLIVNADLKIVSLGIIQDWLDGGEIPGIDDPVIPGTDPENPGPGPENPGTDPEDPNTNPSEDGEYEGYIVYAGEKYNTVTLKDGRTWMAENLRYVPEGKTITPLASEYGEESTGIWYPATFSIVDGTGVVTPSSDPDVIKTQGLLYNQEVLMNGVSMPEEEFAVAESTRGICPAGWHIPTANEWVDLVGACASSGFNNTAAPYYDVNLNGADMSLLNADGFNFLPYPFLNNGTKYNGPYLNKDESREFYGYCSMTYFGTSSSHMGNKLQAFAAMITNNATKSSVNVAYSNLPNGVYVRCIKDME